VPAEAALPRRRPDHGVVRLGAGAAEDDLRRARPHQARHPLAGLLHGGGRRLSKTVDRGGVPPSIPEPGEHRLADPRIERRGGVVVEVGAGHGNRILLAGISGTDPAAYTGFETERTATMPLRHLLAAALALLLAAHAATPAGALPVEPPAEKP